MRMKQLMLFFLLLMTVSLSFAQINPDNITIIRDKWGVPHIYSETDAEAAYGIAWVTAEDDFESMQNRMNILEGIARGKTAFEEGRFLNHADAKDKLAKWLE